MPYATVDDLVEELSEEVTLELTDDADTGTLADPAVQAICSDALGDASALIDSYAGAQYVVPLAPVPAIVNKYGTLIAAYYLYLRRGVVPAAVQAAYDNAVSWLKDLAKGTVVIGETDEQPVLQTPGARAIVAGPQVFTRERLLTY